MAKLTKRQEEKMSVKRELDKHGLIVVVKGIISGALIEVTDEHTFRLLEDTLYDSRLLHPSHKLLRRYKDGEEGTGAGFPMYFKYNAGKVPVFEKRESDTVHAPVFELVGEQELKVLLSEEAPMVEFNRQFIPFIRIMGQYINLIRMDSLGKFGELPIKETWDGVLELFCILEQMSQVLTTDFFYEVCKAVVEGSDEYLPKIDSFVQEVPSRWNKIMTEFMLPYAGRLQAGWDKMQENKAKTSGEINNG